MLWPYSSYTFMLLPIFFIYLFLCQSIKESPVSSPMGRDWKHFSVRVHRVRLGKFQAQRSTSHPHQEVPILEPTSEIPWVCFSLGSLWCCQEGIKEKFILCHSFIRGRLWHSLKGFLCFHLLPNNRGSLLTNLIFNRKLYHYLSGPLAKPNWSMGNKGQGWIKTTWTVPVCQQGCFQIVTEVNASAAAHTVADASMWHEANLASFQKIIPMAGFHPPVYSSQLTLFSTSLMFSQDFTLASHFDRICKSRNTFASLFQFEKEYVLSRSNF